jgi:hypothetical protein
MSRPVQLQKIPGYQAERTLDGILRFRRSWSRYHRPDDVNHLLRLFPLVTLREGYILDYLRLGGTSHGWIWPYARKEAVQGEAELPPALKAVEIDRLAVARDRPQSSNLKVETLYRFLNYETTAKGLFEYAFFVSELWATKSSSRAGDWLTLKPLFTRWQFDRALRQAKGQLKRIVRPQHLDVAVQLSPEGGGEVSFIVFQGGAWERIFILKCVVEADGTIRREIGKNIASLG